MIGVETAETARSRHLQHLQVGADAFAVGWGLLYTAGAAVVLATGAAVALGAIAIAGVGSVVMAPLADGLDPILLAGIDHPETGAVAWVAIAAWDKRGRRFETRRAQYEEGPLRRAFCVLGTTMLTHCASDSSGSRRPRRAKPWTIATASRPTPSRGLAPRCTSTAIRHRPHARPTRVVFHPFPTRGIELARLQPLALLKAKMSVGLSDRPERVGLLADAAGSWCLLGRRLVQRLSQLLVEPHSVGGGETLGALQRGAQRATRTVFRSGHRA